MATLEKDFTATGVGTGLSVKTDDKATYDVAGTFVGTVQLEKSLDGGTTWEVLVTATAATDGTVVNQSPKSAIYRWNCVAFTSGTIETEVADVDVLVQSLGDGKIEVTDAGVVVKGTLAADGAITSGGVAVPTISSTSTLTNKTITAPVLSGTATGTYTLGGTPTITAPTLTGAATATSMTLTSAGFAGSAVLTIGEGASNGLQFKQIDELVDLTDLGATSVALTTPIPAGAVIISAQANVDELVVAGGTTVKVALGLAAGDVDKYGITSDLTLNQKINTLADWAVLGAEEVIAVCGVTSDGSALGDSNITAGAVQVRIVYLQLASMANA